jgi:hypothetical protein
MHVLHGFGVEAVWCLRDSLQIFLAMIDCKAREGAEID